MKKGLPAGLVVNRLGELGRRTVDARGELDVLGDPPRVEPAQRHPAYSLDAEQLAERLGQRVVAPELDVAIGADQQEAAVCQAPSDKSQQQQRRLVGPVQIVEDEDHRP